MKIFIDGACKNNGEPTAIGGWAFIVTENNKIIHKEFGKLRKGKQTNNRAELESLYQALCWFDSLKQKKRIKIYSDSQLVVKGLTGESSRKANRDIWEQIERICLKYQGLIFPIYVESHKENSKNINHKFNCLADKLAKQGANSLILAPCAN